MKMVECVAELDQVAIYKILRKQNLPKNGAVHIICTMKTSHQPNVLIILSDDHGYGDFSAYGYDKNVRTPHLDKLINDSVRCTNAYVTSPICSPSRAAIISGQYQQRWGIKWFDSSCFPDEISSLSEQFNKLDYRTGYFGKVHYGNDQAGDRACPDKHGFSEAFYGLSGRQMGRLHYLHHSHLAVSSYGPIGSRAMAVHPLFDGPNEVEHEGFLTEEIGRRACDFIHENSDEPFFMMVAFNAVHNFCYQLPDTELKKRNLPSFPDWKENINQSYDVWYDNAIFPNLEHGREYYLAQLELMDSEIGNIFATLDHYGIADDTLVVYLTDNGGSTCNYGYNTPLSGGKYTLFEGGIRVPFFVRWPNGGIRGGRTIKNLTSALDLYPSVLSAAGAPAEMWSHTDGINQLMVWRGEPSGTVHDVLHWDCGFQWAIRRKDWKLRYVDENDIVERIQNLEHVDLGIGLQLVDLKSDITESKNLVDQHPEIANMLIQEHRKWQESIRSTEQ